MNRNTYYHRYFVFIAIFLVLGAVATKEQPGVL